MELSRLCEEIQGPSAQAAAEARAVWDGLGKPLGSLGLLEEAIIRAAAWSGRAAVDLSRRELLVFCADNGVVARGVTQCGSEVTAAVARALGRGESTVCHMARQARCEVIPVDVGIRDFPGAPGVLPRRVRNGTEDIGSGPAMSRAACLRAIETGAAVARERCARGAHLLALGEMGIGNTTTGSAVTAVLLDLPPEAVTGRGAGLSDAALARKVETVRRAIAVNRPRREDPVDVVAKVGGLDLAAMCGAFLGGAACRVPVVVDGMISAAAALCAVRLCPAAAGALLASHVSAEPAGGVLLRALGLEAPIAAGMCLGEGGGAVALLPLLDLALAVYRSGHTFGRLGIDAYVPQEE
jgi:nicotinate-nucleotide--dimethylbenzimidazole phosphoribosyltransferase